VAGAASNRRASIGLTTTATPFAGWVLASGGIVISLLLTAQAESRAIAAMVNAVRIKATGFLPLFLSLLSNALENERRIDAAERKIVQPQIVDLHPAWPMILPRRSPLIDHPSRPCGSEGVAVKWP